MIGKGSWEIGKETVSFVSLPQFPTRSCGPRRTAQIERHLIPSLPSPITHAIKDHLQATIQLRIESRCNAQQLVTTVRQACLVIVPHSLLSAAVASILALFIRLPPTLSAIATKPLSQPDTSILLEPRYSRAEFGAERTIQDGGSTRRGTLVCRRWNGQDVPVQAGALR